MFYEQIYKYQTGILQLMNKREDSNEKKLYLIIAIILLFLILYFTWQLHSAYIEVSDVIDIIELELELLQGSFGSLLVYELALAILIGLLAYLLLKTVFDEDKSENKALSIGSITLLVEVIINLSMLGSITSYVGGLIGLLMLTLAILSYILFGEDITKSIREKMKKR